MNRIFASICVIVLGGAQFLGAGAKAQGGETAAFSLVGSTAYNSRELLGFAALIVAQRNGRITANELAVAVEQIYREDGYFLAEARVAGDNRTIIIDEGEIGSVVVEGVDGPTFNLVKSFFRPVVGHRAVTLKEFERAIMLVEDLEEISAVAEVEYLPGDDTATVRVIAEQIDANRGWVTLDHPARELGEAATLSFHQEFYSLLAPGDLLKFDLSATQDFDTGDDSLFGSFAYRTPVGGAGSFAELFLGNVAARRDATTVLVETDIEGNTAILAFGHPVIRDVERYGYALLEIRRSETSVAAGATSFDSGVDVASLSWIFGKTMPSGGAYEYALNLSYGNRYTDPSGFDDGDDQFSHLRFGFGAEVPVALFGSGTSLRAELWGQYSGDRLPALEEFHLGGREEERGYVFAEAQGDSGVSATIELGRDLYTSGQLVRRYRPFGFVDVGYVRNNDPSAAEPGEETLASFGLGMDLDLANEFSVRNYVALPISDGPNTESGDATLYLSVSKSW